MTYIYFNAHFETLHLQTQELEIVYYWHIYSSAVSLCWCSMICLICQRVTTQMASFLPLLHHHPLKGMIKAPVSHFYKPRFVIWRATHSHKIFYCWMHLQFDAWIPEIFKYAFCPFSKAEPIWVERDFWQETTELWVSCQDIQGVAVCLKFTIYHTN